MSPYARDARPLRLSSSSHWPSDNVWIDSQMTRTWIFELTPSVSSETARFVAVANVLHGMRSFARTHCPGEGDAVAIAEASYIASKPLKCDRSFSGDAKKLLRIAWQTELAARVGEVLDDVMLRRVTAQSLPVQAYYAVFSAARALTLTADSPADQHVAVHKDFESQRARRAAGPWALTLCGDPSKVDTCVLSPSPCALTGFNLMEHGHEPIDYAAAGLRMTRRWKFEAAHINWLKSHHNRKRDGTSYMALPAFGKAQILEKLPRTTTMDFLYELRCRTNYRTTDEYGSDASDDDVQRFYEGLLYLTRSGLLLYETQIAQYVGVSVLTGAVEQWSSSVSRIGSWATDAVQQRLQAITGALSS